MRRQLIGVVLAGALLLSGGCVGTHTPRSLIGVRKVALSMAFKDPALAPPVEPKIVLQYVPAPPEAINPVTNTFVPPPLPSGPPIARPALPSAPVVELCPTAPPGSNPDEPAAVSITRPPTEGTYFKKNTGTIKVTGGPIPITLPYPIFSKFVVSNVVTRTEDTFYYGNEPITYFETEDQLLPTFSVKSYYRYTPRELTLQKEEIISDGQVTTFAPTPAIEVLRFMGPGTTWPSAGIDGDHSQAESLQGAIDGNREVIDVCGKMVDTLKVSTTEHRVNFNDGSTAGSGNTDHPDSPIVQNYAPQYGGLVVRREEHSLRVINANGGRAQVQVDVVSQLMSIEPKGTLPF
jgi:hypothetical protein